MAQKELFRKEDYNFLKSSVNLGDDNDSCLKLQRAR